MKMLEGKWCATIKARQVFMLLLLEHLNVKLGELEARQKQKCKALRQELARLAFQYEIFWKD